ncbi:MAG: hypothetical protein ACK5QT_02450 [Oligoflexia bacterium]
MCPRAVRLWSPLRGLSISAKGAARAAILLGSFLTSACESQGFSFLETISKEDSTPECAITAQVPEPAAPGAEYDVKVSGAAGNLSTLLVGTSAAGCDVQFKLNGNPVTSSGVSLILDPVDMIPGLNTVEATSGAVTVSWNVFKNTLPECVAQVPAATGLNLSPGNTANLTANGTDANNDPLEFSWRLNGISVTAPILSTFSGPSSSLALFTPSSGQLGPNTIDMRISDGTDTVSCTWNVSVNSDCVITSTTPTTTVESPTSVRVASATGTVTNFQALAPLGCNHSWKLNNQALPAANGSATLALASSSLDAGSNILEVRVGNGASSSTVTWTVVKNTPPTCASQSPSSVGTTIGVGASPLTLAAEASDANPSDTLSFSWKRNGVAVSSPMFTVVPSGSTASTATFTPDSSAVGTNAIRADIFDGYDTSSCAWTIQVMPVCAVSASSPGASSLKIAYTESTSQTFVATPNDPSCTVSWRINGSVVTGVTGPLLTVTSNQLGTGPPNTVEAVLTNGFATANRTWSVVRNTPPSCDKSPVGTVSMGVGGTQDLTATVTNSDSDPLTFTWSRNGSALNPGHFNVSTSGNTSVATFMPTPSYIGTNSIATSVSDGYDSASCTWSVNVANNCAITTSFPATTTYKVSAVPTTAHVFGVIPSDGACAVTWTLNGGPLPPGPLANITSGDLITSGSANPNVLIATLTNASGSTSRTWNVIKNQAPACSSLNSPVTSVAPAMNYGTTATFSGTATDPDGDSLSSMTWQFNGTPSSLLFNPVNRVSNTSTTTFNPTVSQVGNLQNIGVVFGDGYDEGSCSWTVEIRNPNTVEILSCTPANSVGSPVVVTSTGVGSTQTLTVVASNASGFTWTRNGSGISGTTPTMDVSSSGLSSGVYTYRAIASDAQGNSDFCDYYVKINSPPQISTVNPSVGTYKVNYGDTLSFAVSATDNNNDSLTYTWTLNGAPNSTLTSGSSTSTFSPNYSDALLGTNTVTVTVSDGAETATRSWTVEVNQFSTACNTLYNSPVLTHGGKICSLVGVPGAGEGLQAASPLADQTLVRIKPYYMSDDGSGNLFFSDGLSHVVGFLNRSNAAVTRFDRTVGPGELIYVMGIGADGLTIDGVTGREFKLNTPLGVAYDSTAGALYVADYNQHRVVRLSSNGVATTVIGSTAGTWAGNSATFNTDGNSGTYQSLADQGHSCAHPVGLTVVNDTTVMPNRRWLYVACAHPGSSSGSIKRMDIDPSSAQYGRVWIAVGRTSSGVIQQGNYDGTMGSTGEAMVNEPWGLTSDPSGNIYWIERNSARLRMATTGGQPMTFFGGTGQVTQNLTISAVDFSTTTPLSSGSITHQAYSTSGASNRVLLHGTGSVLASACHFNTAQIADGSSVPVAVASNTNITLAASGGGAGAFFSDSSCTTAIPSNIVTVPSGRSQVGFFYRNPTATASATITASSTGLTNGTISPAVMASTGTATRLSIAGPTRSRHVECTRYSVSLLNGSNQISTFTSNRTVRLVHNAIGTFYSDANCSTDPIYTLTIPAGQASGTFYYAPIVRALPNQVVSLSGGTANNTISPASGSQAGGLSMFRLPRGLALHQDSSGNILGFFVTNSDMHRIHYINNTASSITLGGTTMGGYQAGIVVGTGTAGYNGETVGNLARINFPHGLYSRPGGSELLVADFDNNRLRNLNISVNSGSLDSFLGAGRSRSGHLGDTPTPATQVYLNQPSQITIDNTSRTLYVADSANNRVRSVSLLTGEVNTALGRTYTVPNIDDNELPTNATIQAPRGLAIMSSGNARFLVYADNPLTTTINVPCLVRALNLTPAIAGATATPLFGINMNPSRVYTVAGDFVKGCYAWNSNSPSAANVAGTPGIQNKLYNPEGIASDGQNLYISNHSDHCILKMNSAGNISQVAGICGTAGATGTPASSSIFQITNPTAIAVDPLFAANGNFFFIDRVSQNPTRVNYVNCRSTSVQIGATTVVGATAPNCQVATIWNTGSLAASPFGAAYGLAAFDTQICIAAGQPGNANQGAHNVSCYNRSSALSPQTLRVGAFEGGNPLFRGGAPLGSEQEGAQATSSFLNGPYGLAFDADGNLYISERNNHIVRMVRRWW